MDVPFEDAEKTNEAIAAFFKDLEEIRKKHKIANVHCIVQGKCMYESEEGTWINSIHLGDSLKALSMTAWAYGLQDADHRELINKIVSQAGKSKKMK